MGVWDFIKDAGAKVFGKDEDETVESAAQNAEEVRERLARSRSAAIERHLAQAGLAADGVTVDARGDRVILEGRVTDQETREKVVLAVGNITGVTQVDDRLEVEHSASEATFYTVERGDTLSGIAKQHYGDASKYPVIFEANRPMLEDPDRIYPGQVLRIPDLES